MSRTLFALLFVVAIASIHAFPQAGDSECGPNEEFQPCGSDCEPSCANPNPTVCTLRCRIGCQCKAGFYRDASKNCVLTQDCQ